ncbi:hypothetical protein KPSA3_04626 [Pseudomonas syringae pv. actinidiae]|uniref:Uncharacterized protein n=1 Tax=Pseudomonas syringae pv. actinidiae TaxID=103796 RepID=A0AAN4Q796_PSESF|nr:hypothetical protein KPSA3_04626 [Pseudomonas syringae pv. actinidiae]
MSPAIFTLRITLAVSGYCGPSAVSFWPLCCGLKECFAIATPVSLFRTWLPRDTKNLLCNFPRLPDRACAQRIVSRVQGSQDGSNFTRCWRLIHERSLYQRQRSRWKTVPGLPGHCNWRQRPRSGVVPGNIRDQSGNARRCRLPRGGRLQRAGARSVLAAEARRRTGLQRRRFSAGLRLLPGV